MLRIQTTLSCFISRIKRADEILQEVFKNSWRAHKTSVTCIEIISQHNLIATGSLERVVKLWTQYGQNSPLAHIKEFIDGSISRVIYWDIKNEDLSSEIAFRQESVKKTMAYLEEKTIEDSFQNSNNFQEKDNLGGIPVKGSNGNTYYIVDGKCNCKGFQFRGDCKHIRSVA